MQADGKRGQVAMESQHTGRESGGTDGERRKAGGKRGQVAMASQHTGQEGLEGREGPSTRGGNMDLEQGWFTLRGV